MPNPDRKMDTSYLSADQTDKRGIIHRDLLAHALRWSHVTKDLVKDRRPQVSLLDIGCGVEAPLAKTLYSNRLTNVEYIGLDYGPIKPDVKFSGAFQPTFYDKVNAVDWLHLAEHATPFNYMTSFEVFEHMLPDNLARLLVEMRKRISTSGRAWISTPCYSAKVGAAANHINEMTIGTLGTMIEAAGFEVVNRWGTFASQRDYLPELENLVELSSPEGQFTAEHGFARQLWHQLNQYYDANLTAILWAPLFPDQSRNNLWELKPARESIAVRDSVGERKFAPVLSPLGDKLGQCTNVDAWKRAAATLGLPDLE